MHPPRSLRLALLAPVVALLGGTALAQEILIQEDDVVVSIGEVQAIINLTVNDAFIWMTTVDTDAPTTEDFVVLRNGFPTMQEGVLLPEPLGASIKSFHELTVNNNSNIGWGMDLNDTANGNGDNEAVYWNVLKLLQEEEDVMAPEATPGSTWKEFDRVRLNDNEDFLVLAEITDPNDGKVQALFFVPTDGMGNVLSETMIVREKAAAVGVPGDTIQSLHPQDHSTALNNVGDYMYGGKLKEASADSDMVVWLNDQIVAREGDEVPGIEGRVYDNLLSSEVDLNDLGEYAFNASMDGNSANDDIIVVNGEVFVREGDRLGPIAPQSIESFGAAPVYIANSGDVFWYCLTNNSSGGQDQIYWRNEEIIVEEGRTTVGGRVVNTVLATPYAFDTSDSGRHWVAEVGVQGVGCALVYKDFGSLVRIPGCSGNAATLDRVVGDPLIGNTVTFEIDGGQGNGVTPLLLFSTRPSVPGSPCGVDGPFGELLIDLGAPAGTTLGSPWTGSGVEVDVALPNDTSLVDLVFYGQAFFVDFGGVSTELVRASNAYRMEIGAP